MQRTIERSLTLSEMEIKDAIRAYLKYNDIQTGHDSTIVLDFSDGEVTCHVASLDQDELTI